MDDAHNEVEFKFTADTQGVDKAFDEVSNKVDNLKKDMGEMDLKINWGEGEGTVEEYQQWFEKTTKEAEEYARAQEEAAAAQDKVASSARSVAPAIEETGQAAEQAKYGFEDLKEDIYQTIGSINDLDTKAQALFASILAIETTWVKGSLESFADYEDALYGLRTTVDTVEGSMADAMEGIHSVTADGLLSDEDAARAMRNLLAYGYSVQEATEMLRAMTASAEANRKEGYSVAEAVVRATQGIKQGSSMMMKFAGNTETASRAEARYAASLGKSASELTKAEKKQALYNSTIDAGAKYTSSAANYSNTYSAATQRLSNSVEELQVAFGQAMAPIAGAAANLLSWIAQNKEAIVVIGTFVGVIAGSGGIIWALSKLIPMISSAIAWFAGLNVATKGIVLGLATVAAAMTAVSLISASMAEDTEDLTTGTSELSDDLDDSADSMDDFGASTGGAAGAVSDLNEELAKLERDYLRDLKEIAVNHQQTIDSLTKQIDDLRSDYLDDLKEIETKHLETIEKLTTQLRDSNADYQRAVEERKAAFEVQQAEEERAHQEKVDELMVQIDFLRRYNNEYNRQKLKNLEFALAKENALYKKQTEAAKAEMDLQNENDRIAYETKRAQYQAELDEELAFLQKHRESLKQVQDMILADEIEILERKYNAEITALTEELAEEQAFMDKHKDELAKVQDLILLDEIETLQERYEEQKKSYEKQAQAAGGAGASIAQNLSDKFSEYLNTKNPFASAGDAAANQFTGNFIDNVNKTLTSDNGFFAGLSQRLYNFFSGAGFTNEVMNYSNGQWVGSGKYKGWALGGYTGPGGVDDVAGVVHKGEYVLPQDMVDQNTGLPKSMGTTVVNIYLQGTFATSKAEQRKVAMQIADAIKQVNHSRLEGATT